MNNINASVLLSSFFESDSLIDIKRSLPKLQIGTVNVSSLLCGYLQNNYFDGSNRHNGDGTVPASNWLTGIYLKGKSVLGNIRLGSVAAWNDPY